MHHYAFLISKKQSDAKYVALYTSRAEIDIDSFDANKLFTGLKRYINIYKKDCNVHFLQVLPNDLHSEEIHKRMDTLARNHSANYIKRCNHYLPKLLQNNTILDPQRSNEFSLYEIDFNKMQIVFIDRGTLTYLRAYFDSDSLYTCALIPNSVYLNKYIFKPIINH